MRTRFSTEQLTDPAVLASEQILRKCVHCGFCNATCPTYQLLGDELDGPRGRIYLMKEMLENEAAPTADVVKHIDRCLSCLGCMTTCPSGVHYMHLVDHARDYIHAHYRRPLGQRLMRRLLAMTLPYPTRFRWLLAMTRPVKPLISRLPGRLGRATRLIPPLPKTHDRLEQWHPAEDRPLRGTVGLLAGCVQQVLGSEINAATVRVLTRLGFNVMVLTEQPCCGALEHHLGMREVTLARIKRNVLEWNRLIDTHSLQAILVNTSGCGTMLKDYAYLLRDAPEEREAAERISGIAKDISEFLHSTGLDALSVTNQMHFTVAYQNPCSLHHGQKIQSQPVELLTTMGFTVRRLPEEHLCCGSAGIYNVLQPEIAEQLGRRKASHIKETDPDIIATGNLGCITQISHYTDRPIVHSIQLIDWASGGPCPRALANWTKLHDRR